MISSSGCMWSWMNVWVKLHGSYNFGRNRLILLLKHNNDKRLNINSSKDKCKFYIYKHMDMWNIRRVSIVNQILPSVQDDDEHHNAQATQH